MSLYICSFFQCVLDIVSDTLARLRSCYLPSEEYWFLYNYWLKTSKLCRFVLMLCYGEYVETRDVSQALLIHRTPPSKSIPAADLVRTWFWLCSGGQWSSTGSDSLPRGYVIMPKDIADCHNRSRGSYWHLVDTGPRCC